MLLCGKKRKKQTITTMCDFECVSLNLNGARDRSKRAVLFQNSTVVFVCVYMPSTGIKNLAVLETLYEALRSCRDNGNFLIVVGDWNCTAAPWLDRNNREPH